MTNTFYIVRHGESENNVLEIYDSQISTMNQYPLTEKGKTQVMHEAQKLKAIDKIYSSPFRRTLETADIFQSFSHADLHVDHRLREINLGHLHGKTHIDLPALDTAEEMYGGESIIQIRDRMLDFVSEINRQLEQQRVLIVTHGGPLAILQHYLQSDAPFQFTGLSGVPPNGIVVELNV